MPNGGMKSLINMKIPKADIKAVTALGSLVMYMLGKQVNNQLLKDTGILLAGAAIGSQL